MTFIELRSLNTGGLAIKLRRNRCNMKGVGEYLDKFGLDDKKNNSLSEKEIVEMMSITKNNINEILGEFGRRMKVTN